MKPIYIYLILLLCAMGMQAQEPDYVPLVQEGQRWIYLFSDVTAKDGYDPVTDEDYAYYVGRGDYAYFMEFRGDTIINDMTYKKLYKSMSRDFDEHTLRPVACMREEDKHVYGFDGNDTTEYEFYDFNDMETFTHEMFIQWAEWYDGAEGSATPTTVTVGGQPRRAYKVFNSWGWYSLVIEGIGNDETNMLSFGPMGAVPTCICPLPMGLAQVEDLDGNILYKGRYGYYPYGGNGHDDITDVNTIINVLLGKQVFSRHYDYCGTSKCDVNADYQIDIEDLNAMINILLKKN